MSKTKLINKIKKMHSIHNMFKIKGKKGELVVIEMVCKEDVIKIIRKEYG